MSSMPGSFNLPPWKVILGISLSLTFLMLIEKLFGLHKHKKPKKPKKPKEPKEPKEPKWPKEEDHPLVHYPGFSPVLGTGETQTTLLRAWVEIHGHVAQAQAAEKAAQVNKLTQHEKPEKTPYEKVFEKIAITRGGHNTHHGATVH